MAQARDRSCGSGAEQEQRHIKSRDRVRGLGEVYSQPRQFEAMLALIPEAFSDKSIEELVRTGGASA